MSKDIEQAYKVGRYHASLNILKHMIEVGMDKKVLLTFIRDILKEGKND